MRNYWILRLNRHLYFTLILTFFALTSFSQSSEAEYSPGKSGYYLFPIKPGIRNTLAGTMGELRSNHFHTGIDIRTESRTGLMVQAAADGYVSRIAISPYGYGNAVYITHPNGHISVYGHLEQFTGELADYIRQEQYRKQQFDIDLFFRKGQFDVKKGDTIAYSGNSGGSGGPHLHFDIRDRNNKPLNPLHYGFNEVLDQTPPVAEELAITTLNKNSRVNGKFGREVFTLRRVGNDYVIDEPIQVTGEIGIELYAYDKLDNARFRCGVNEIVLDVDNNLVFKQDITTFNFGEQRNILKHMDYKELKDTGHRYHKLFVDDGNELQFYTTNAHQGKLNFNSLAEHPAKILMKDSYGNESKITFSLKSIPTAPEEIKMYGHEQSSIYLQENTLVIKADINNSELPATVSLYLPEKKEITPDYTINGNVGVYLWDMRKGLPFSVDINGKNTQMNYKDMIPPSSSYKYYSELIDISFTQADLFDTLYLQTDYQYDSVANKEYFFIGDTDVPLRSYIGVTLKPQIPYKEADKYAVYLLNERGAAYYKGGDWNYDKISFSTRDFGRFTILKDINPPSIVPVKVTRNELRFKIYDDRAGIKEFKCSVDGSWVLMNYDYKTNLIWSEKLDPKKPFTGEVKLVVTDNSNNEKVYTTKIN
ncbi:M23 family metallopeptidase [Fulvivirga sediminis]|uniref:M23 family metallopeptidase n=1 Tax=Fulvivirga sediminis TaxID=2803949 RepID=A0A937F806_9BACT|nr:M23 family metallopeptidase [Fulvivirga sediminis]MBL3655995.1 M23 family metallopeptidase [Fulvivirga sediminis]